MNGACLTVERVVRGGFTVHVVQTTAGRTLFGEYSAGRPVNLERAVRAADRLGGHLVQGHVDSTGIIRSTKPEGEAVICEISVPRRLSRYIVEKGSIAVDGISLTVVDPRRSTFKVSLLAYTLSCTTLGKKGVGDRVNIELDMLAKYIERLLGK